MEQGQLSPPLMLPNFSLPHLIPLDDVGISSDSNDNLTSDEAQKEKRVCRSPPLRHWLNQHRDHPYPTKQEKETLAQDANLTMSQVCNWFANARRRLKIASTTTAAPTPSNTQQVLNSLPLPTTTTAATSRLEGVPLPPSWPLPHFPLNPAWPTMPELLQQQQQHQVVPGSGKGQQPAAGMAVDLRVKKKKKIDVDAFQLLPGVGLQPINFDFANNNQATSVSHPMADLLYLANLQQTMTAGTSFVPCTGQAGCACVQCLRRWLLATQQQQSDSPAALHSSSILPSLPPHDDSYPSAGDLAFPVGGGRGKFKQAMMNRYLEDTEQHTNIKLRRQSGSLGSEDSDGHSSSDCTSPSSKDHIHLEEPSQATMWPTSGSNGSESEDLYWKEVMAALALTTMSKSHTLRSDPQVNPSLTTPRL